MISFLDQCVSRTPYATGQAGADRRSAISPVSRSSCRAVVRSPFPDRRVPVNARRSMNATSLLREIIAAPRASHLTKAVHYRARILEANAAIQMSLPRRLVYEITRRLVLRVNSVVHNGRPCFAQSTEVRGQPLTGETANDVDWTQERSATTSMFYAARSRAVDNGRDQQGCELRHPGVGTP